MIDNHKASINAPGVIAGYISHCPVTMRCRVETRGSARISVTAIDIPEALLLAAWADRLMLMAYPDPEPAEVEDIRDCIAEIVAMIRDGATLAIENVEIGADMTAEALPALGDLANDTVAYGAPPSQPWPVWPEAGRGLALVGETGPQLTADEIARIKSVFLGIR